MLRRRWIALLLPLSVLVIFPLAAGARPVAADDAVVQMPCDEAAFDTALATAQNSGGGLFTRGNVALNNVSLRTNQAAASGGGLYLDYAGNPIWGAAFLNRVTVAGNTALDGGGLYL